jgi:hypothetical protein
VAVPSRDAALESLQKLRPAAGTAELSRIAALIAAVPGSGTAALADAANDQPFGSALGEGEAGALWKAIGAWPPGTAWDFAFSFLNARDRHKNSPGTDHSPLQEEDDGSADDSRHALETSMKTGVAGKPGGDWEMTLKEWLREDPGTAIVAVKSMPAGEGRTAAVNAAMAYMAKTDPAGALAFFLQSGEPKAGAGAASALAQLLIEPPPGTGEEGTRKSREFLARLSTEQRETLTFSLAVELHNDRDGTLLHDGHLIPLAMAVLELNAAGIQDFFKELARFPNDAEEMRRFIDSAAAPGQSPGAAQAREALESARIEAEVESGEAAGRFLAGAWGDRISPSSKIDPNTIVERHAPAMMSSLVRTGRLPEALQVLDRLHDPEVWSDSFQAVLPAWMDADPKAARAAFNAAPLTALERERLQRSPAFLLHP